MRFLLVLGLALVASAAASSLRVVVNTPALDDPSNTLVQGAGIDILSARLGVAGGAAAGASAVLGAADGTLLRLEPMRAPPPLGPAGAGPAAGGGGGAQRGAPARSSA